MCGAGTVNEMFVLLFTPPTVTFTGPEVVVADEIVSKICVSDQLTTVSLTALIVIVLPLWVAPNPVPLICTWLPTGPLAGDNPVTTGFGIVNTTSRLLIAPFCITLTAPVLAPAGTVAIIWVSLQLTTEPVQLLKLTVPPP